METSLHINKPHTGLPVDSS